MNEQLIQGFTLQASLIFGLGAQNLFLIDRGLNRKSHLLAASVCSICDCALIFFGVLGAGSYLAQNSKVRIVVTIIGIIFLGYYGFQKLYERPEEISQTSKLESTKNILVQSLGFSLLNPHVYLDTFVLIGSYSAQFNSLQKRVWFGAGASLYSIIWFFSLVLFSAVMSRYLNRPSFRQKLNRVAGALLIFLGIKLLCELGLG